MPHKTSSAKPKKKTRTCWACKTEKPLDKKHFHIDNHKSRGFQGRCKQCDKLVRRSVRYKVDLPTIKKMISNMPKKCPICKNHLVNPNLDHCHITGDVRAFICGSCNFGLGFFKDSIGNLKRAVEYLEKHSKDKK